jgi:hypothetical protein
MILLSNRYFVQVTLELFVCSFRNWAPLALLLRPWSHQCQCSRCARTKILEDFTVFESITLNPPICTKVLFFQSLALDQVYLLLLGIFVHIECSPLRISQPILLFIFILFEKILQVIIQFASSSCYLFSKISTSAVVTFLYA